MNKTLRLRWFFALYTILLSLPSFAEQGDWQRALPGKSYTFPADHFSHPDFKTEWWYATGNLSAEDGRLFGFQITFFRQGLRAPGKREGTTSRFVMDHLHFAHFAISDPQGKEFYFDQQTRRGSFGEAGSNEPIESAGANERLAWVGNSSINLTGEGKFTIAAQTAETELNIEIVAQKEPVFHGEGGASQKAEGEGNASHYYSYTRMGAEGQLRIGKEKFTVKGLAWLDREWSTSVLGEGQIGWDWFALHLDDGSDLMIYQMRRRDGQLDPYSSGSYVAADGTHRKLSANDFELIPKRHWKSNESGGEYPMQWQLHVPSLGVKIEVEATQDKQELALLPVTYWEGMVKASGTHTGRGYLEMTGYAGEVTGLK